METVIERLDAIEREPHQDWQRCDAEAWWARHPVGELGEPEANTILMPKARNLLTLTHSSSDLAAQQDLHRKAETRQQ